MEFEKATPYKNKRVTCPHCFVDFNVSITWEIAARKFRDDNELPYTMTRGEKYLLSLNEGVKQQLESFKQEGLIDVLMGVWQKAHLTKPEIPEKTFLQWVNGLKKMNIPRRTMGFLQGEYAPRSFRVVQAFGIAGILVDEVLTELVPKSVIDGDNLNGVQATTRNLAVEQWIRTKYGYVAGRGLLYGELQKRCYGAFDKPGVTSI